MTAALLALAAALALGSGDPLNDRISEANGAAQSLQGPLDGAWTLRDEKGAVLYHLQISELPEGAAGGAWSGADNRFGGIEIARRGDRVDLVIDGATVSLRRRGGLWRGASAGRSVILSRSLATGRPAV